MATSSILIVDDEPINLEAMKQILCDHYSLVFALSGHECLVAAKKHRPSLILLDIQMPDMDGYAVCRTLKKDPLTENIPVIFVSSLGKVGDETTGFESGAVDYIIKPLSPPIVLARVAIHLSLVRATILMTYVRQLESEKAKTARLTRILSVLSETNSAIVRIQNPEALTEEACRIAVEHGGFGVAWIGLTNDASTLKLAACRGMEPVPLTRLIKDQTGSGTLHNTLPGRVIRLGQTIVYNDVTEMPRDDVICADAHRRGYLSLAGLPLKHNEQVTGVMILYAREAYYFDEEEIKLLKALAGDISFSLLAIENEQRAKFLAMNDALTALPNTNLFLDRLGQSIQLAERSDSKVFVINLNLDRFNLLNDTFGRHAGDQVLGQVAQRLMDGASHLCTIARIGADNFALSGELTSDAVMSVLCESIVRMVSEPMLIDGHTLTIVARLGIAIFPTDAKSAESLLTVAEAALKQAKAAKARYSFYSPLMNARIIETTRMENMLRTAMEQQQFALHFQPKVSLVTGEIVGAEALIRWNSPAQGWISPQTFIPVAEETGLIVPIGEWVIRAVFAQQAAWKREALPTVPIALNLSALQFRDSDLVAILKLALSDYDVPADMIDLELTETLVMQNPKDAEQILNEMRKMGFGLSLDDFGTGYSSLAYLKRFPFNTVKIDRAFVIDIIQNPDDAVIAMAIIGMAHNLRMKVVAEGVETQEQLDFLRSRQCDQMQGYYFSPAVPAEELMAMLVGGKRMAFPTKLET